MATARKTTATAAGAKTPAKKAAAPAAKAAKAAKTAPPPKTMKIPASAKSAEARADKPRKAKLVRDSFTIPKAEYTVLEELKVRAGRLGRPTRKSEVLRAGVIALAAMADAAFLASIDKVPALKTGRPAKD